MAYQATILNVMIASPSDVAEERQLVRDAIYEWNAIHSKQFGVMLNPVGWETHVAPEMGNRPQEIINQRILNNSDILLAIFWTRLGTETGEYVSGTVEEISKHINSQKLTSIYICDKPIPPSQITEQYQKLQLQIREWMPSGVLDFYNDLSSFKQKIKDHLSLHIQQNEYIQNIVNELNSNDTPIETSTKQAIEPSDEMVQILLNAGNAESQINFRRYLGGQSLFVGNLDINLNKARELAKWEDALNELLNLGLIKDRGYKGELFDLTKEGWDAFDQLKAQLKENQ
ncbi:DUF4062 domain-containing protein [Acinetobacter terrae]|uniref:DUF4062 domain-containing protein n=1 Tax=Acinetobacter terrae TaxID=2731247 RepID=A0A8E4FE54_9GAMM|nr:DUF4062 domain-containing protein [Acinetobacter terrae]NNH39622.1 DUF4062 domain-containing protein [Acinetobacter terrae]NNH88526.1 DUF4062 domain-containing protein [Acinetobacter terrae]